MSCVVLEYKTRTNLDPNWGKTAIHTLHLQHKSEK